MLGRAAGIIEREMKGSSLLQQKIDTSNLQGLIQGFKTIIDATSMETKDKQKLLAFMQNQQGSDSDSDSDSDGAADEKKAAALLSLDSQDDDADLGAPAPDAYKSKSGGIVETINDMKAEAEGELSEARKAENNLKHNYDMLKVSLEDSIKAATHEMDEAKKDSAEAEETKAVAEGELVVTEKDLAVAKEGLDLVHEDCMQKATDHDLTVKGRKEELAALGKAKKDSSTNGS